jgi:hypothetical protein
MRRYQKTILFVGISFLIPTLTFAAPVPPPPRPANPEKLELDCGKAEPVERVPYIIDLCWIGQDEDDREPDKLCAAARSEIEKTGYLKTMPNTMNQGAVYLMPTFRPSYICKQCTPPAKPGTEFSCDFMLADLYVSKPTESADPRNDRLVPEFGVLEEKKMPLHLITTTDFMSGGKQIPYNIPAGRSYTEKKPDGTTVEEKPSDCQAGSRNRRREVCMLVAGEYTGVVGCMPSNQEADRCVEEVDKARAMQNMNDAKPEEENVQAPASGEPAPAGTLPSGESGVSSDIYNAPSPGTTGSSGDTYLDGPTGSSNVNLEFDISGASGDSSIQAAPEAPTLSDPAGATGSLQAPLIDGPKITSGFDEYSDIPGAVEHRTNQPPENAEPLSGPSGSWAVPVSPELDVTSGVVGVE